MKQFNRADRISQQMLRDISIFVNEELSDHTPALITFTQVRISKDLRYATVYYSVLDRKPGDFTATAFLDRNKKRIRKHVGGGLNMRHIPEIAFKFDPSVEEGLKIEQLLNEIKADSKD